MSETVEGEIDTLAQTGDNYGIKIGDTWYNLSKYASSSLKQEQRQLEKGDKVELELDQPDSEFYEEIDVISGDEQAGSEESSSSSAPNGSERGGQTSSDYIPDQKARRQNMATMKAVETVNQRHPDLTQGEFFEMVSEYAVGIFNRSKSLGDE